MQFHPTALRLDGPRDGFLITEAVRGEGALLYDSRASASWTSWRRATRWRSPSTRELERTGERGGLARHARAWRSSASRTSRPRSPRWGSTPRRDLLPVAPAAHYTMGGVATDLDGRSTRGRACTPSARPRAPGSTARTGSRRTRSPSASCSAAAPRSPLATSRRSRRRPPPEPRAEHRHAARRGHARRALAPRRPAARRRGSGRAARRPLPARSPDRRRLPRARGEPRRAPAHRPSRAPTRRSTACIPSSGRTATPAFERWQ